MAQTRRPPGLMEKGFVTANGIRVFYVAEGDGPLVLLCHGFPEAWFSWRHQLTPIAEAGFRAVAIDLPGYGLSDKPDTNYDVVWLCECLAGVIEGLGHERAVMVGHDWGGLLVWPFARLHPDRTAAVIGLNTPDLPRFPIPPTELFAQMGDTFQYILNFQERGAMEARFESDPRQFLTLFYLGAAVKREVFTDDVIDRYLAYFEPLGAITPPLEYYRNMDRSWELTEHIADVKVEVPSLMISAAGDPVLSPSMADGMEERVLDLERVLIEDCGHWTQQEQPEATTKHITDFLGRLR
ncbi:MAG: alpha/beta fold hydrolase [Actinomycetota bacterium]